MALQRLNVALLGCMFMGRAHSFAWANVGNFFPVPVRPTLHTVCGLSEDNPLAFAEKWGWQNAETNWETVVANPDIDLVDVSTPNNMHAPMAMAAMKAGKIVVCEKPLAGTFLEALKMSNMAQALGAKTFVWFCYRHAPAVAQARKLVMAGKIGQIHHSNWYYPQDWADGSVPLLWRFIKKLAGSGSLGDLGAHIVDLCRFITGEEIKVKGAMLNTVIKQRTIPTHKSDAGIAEGAEGGGKMGNVTVDDSFAFLAELSGGSMAVFQAARQATGNQNNVGFELNGDRGSLRFSFEDMNHLYFYDATAPREVQGWTQIMVTHGASHPYVNCFWPDAHLIGYGENFISQAYSTILAANGENPVVPVSDFADAAKTQSVLHSVEEKAAE